MNNIQFKPFSKNTYGGGQLLLCNVDEITDTIDKIYRDQKLRNKLIQLGFERAKYFSDKNSMIDEYIKVFEQYMN